MKKNISQEECDLMNKLLDAHRETIAKQNEQLEELISLCNGFKDTANHYASIYCAMIRMLQESRLLELPDDILDKISMVEKLINYS